MSKLNRLLADPARGLAWARLIYCLNCIYLVQRFIPNHRTLIEPEYFRPIYLFYFFEAPRGFLFMKIALIVALLIHAVGWCGRWAPGIAAVLALLLFGWPYCYGAGFYADAPVVLMLIAAAILPPVRRHMDEQDLRVNIFLMRVLLIHPFFAAGLSKLRYAGWEWTSAENQNRMYEWNIILFRDQMTLFSQVMQRLLLKQNWFLHATGIFVFILELTSPLAFLSRKVAMLIVPALAVMHLGFALILDHNFFMFMWPLYLYWLPWKVNSQGKKSAVSV